MLSYKVVKIKAIKNKGYFKKSLKNRALKILKKTLYFCNILYTH